MIGRESVPRATTEERDLALGALATLLTRTRAVTAFISGPEQPDPDGGRPTPPT